MANLDWATIFWLVSMGMVVGAATKVVLGKRGLGLIANIICGVFGTVTVGVCGFLIQFPGSTLFGFMGSLAILFMANVFFLQPDPENH